MTWMYCIQGEVVEGDIGYHIALAAGGGSSQHQHHNTPWPHAVGAYLSCHRCVTPGVMAPDLSLSLSPSLSHTSRSLTSHQIPQYHGNANTITAEKMTREQRRNDAPSR